MATGRDDMLGDVDVGDATGFVYPVAYAHRGWHESASFGVPAQYFDNHDDNFTNFSGRRLRDFEKSN